MKGSMAPITALEFSGDGRRVMAAGGNREVRLWDVASGQDVAILPLDHNADSATFSPDGRTLAVGDIRGNVHFLETASPTEVLVRTPARFLDK